MTSELTVTEPIQQLLNAIRRLPRREQLRIIERIVHELAEAHEASSPDAIIGLFGDQPDLIEAVSDEAMQARERDPLRLTRG